MSSKSLFSRLYQKYKRYKIVEMLWGNYNSYSPGAGIRIRRIKELAPSLTCSMILDIGCGEIQFKKLISSNGYITLDIPPNPQAVVYGDAGLLPFRDTCFDLVLCLDVLEHVEDPWKVASEINRVLANNGKALITVPGVYPFHDCSFPEYFRFNIHGLERLFPIDKFDYLIAEQCSIPLLRVLLSFWSLCARTKLLIPLGKLVSMLTNRFHRYEAIDRHSKPKSFNYASHILLLFMKKAREGEQV